MKNHQQQTKITTTSARQTKALPSPDSDTAKQGRQAEGKQSIMLPTDPAAQRRTVKNLYISTVGANVLAAQMRPFVTCANEDDGQGAQVFIAAIKESVQPRDAIEEMLVLQLAWTHGRLARLSSIAHNQELRENVRIVHDACDRCAATFRQHMLALAQYRRPPRSDAFVAIRHANIAQQQVIANGPDQNPARLVASSEVGATPAKALPPCTEGIDLAAAVGPAAQAMAVERRPRDDGSERKAAE